MSTPQTVQLEEMDPVAETCGSPGDPESSALAPVVGILVGLGVSVLIWLAAGSLLWIAFRA